MSDRYVLIVDDDETFRERLSQLLPSQGVRLVIAEEDSETLALLHRHRPKIVFIGVELPDKDGFSVFTKVKKAQRNVPVVLTTSTVPKVEMKLHEKLRIHAVAYFDKRELTDEKLLDFLEARGFSPPETSDANDEVSVLESNTEPTAEKPERRETDIDPRLTQFLDPQTAAIFDEIDEEASEFVRVSKTESGDVSPERLAELEELVARLEEQLEQARSDAMSSPFSSEFGTLREAANRKEEEIGALKETINRRDGYVLVVKRKLAELAKKLVDAQKDHEQSAEEATELKERLDSTQKKQEHVADELEEQHRLLEREIEALKEAVSEEQVRVTVTRHELEGQITELRGERVKFVQEGEESHQKALTERETILREERATAIADLKEKYSAKLKEVDENRVHALSEARTEHEKEIAALHETQLEALERAAAEASEAMRNAAAKSAEGLEQSNEQRVAELTQTEQKRTTDLEAAEKRHRAKLDVLLQKHGAEREELEKKAGAAIKANESMLDEVNAKVQDVLKSWEKERQSHHETRERYETDLAGLQAEHTKHLDQAEQDQFSVLAGLSRKFRDERTRALEAERNRGELKLEELNHEHATALASRDKRLVEKIASLRAVHESALAEKDREIEQKIADAIECATTSLTKEHEESRKSHANQLASLRQSKEQDIAALQASHMEALAKKDQEAQQALREGVEQVKADTGDQIDQLQEEHARAAASLRKDYEEERGTLEEVHRSALSQRENAARTTLRGIEDERDEARVVLDGVRAEMAERAAKHRSTVSVLEEQHKAELKDLKDEAKAKVSQLEDEKQFLASSVEKLKRQSTGELERATDALAHETELHQANRERYERRVSELKSRHAEGLERVENDWMQKLEHFERNLNELSEKAASTAQHDGKATLEKVRLQHEDDVASLRKEFGMELATSKQQIQRASGFEKSYQEAARELTTVQGQLESLTRDLADAHQELAERDEIIAKHQKKVADNKETIDSLKTVINDFSHSVDSYAQDRDDQDQTISSLKEVIADMYRSIDAREEKN